MLQDLTNRKGNHFHIANSIFFGVTKPRSGECAKQDAKSS